MLFQRYGVRKTTMEDIAADLNMGKSTLYYYFKNKNDVYAMVLKAEFDLFKKTIEEKLSDVPNAEQMITAFIKSVFDNIFKFPNLLMALMENVQDKASKIIRDIVDQFEVWQSSNIECLLTKGVKAGEFRKMTDDQIVINSQAIGIAMFGIRGVLISEKDKEAFEHKIESLISLLLQGIGYH